MIEAAYIHIPFCEHICHYCDFNKVFLKGQPVDEYLLSLEEEIKLSLSKYPSTHFKSIFVGGGTPTSLSEKQLKKLCDIIQTHLPFASSTEYTFEANPGDLSKEKFEILYEHGVNRISFGVQSFNDELLQRIGRVHRAEDVYKSVELAKETGFKNISIDLIYNLPGQTIEDFKDTLEKAFTLDIVHYSGYSLIIEPKTVFYNLLKKGRLQISSEEIEATMYELLMEEMHKHGFYQYEISNFSKTGYESRHNLTYWNNDEYFGFGAGAHSYVNGKRRSNHGPLKKYMNDIRHGQLPIVDEHQVTKKEQMEEEMFLGLRRVKGVSVDRFLKKFGENPLQLFHKEIRMLQARKLLKVEDDYIFLTKDGRLLGNEVFQEFLLPS